MLETFTPIALDQLDDLSLQNRQDTKYIMHRKNLNLLLSKMAHTHLVLTIDGKRIFTYNNLYFDTPDLECYMKHQSGHMNRYKVRIREYVETGQLYFEVKFKNNKDRTVKNRFNMAKASEDISRHTHEFVEKYSPFQFENLIERANTDFNRITLASFEQQHRVTIDQNLTLYFPDQPKQVLENLIIIEVKQGRASGRSPLWYHLKESGAQESSVSKYCLANNVLDPELKANRFKPRNRKINKVCHASIHT